MKKLNIKNIILILITCLITFHAQAQFPEFKILPDDTNRDQEFGHSVSVSGDYAAVGTIKDDERGVLAGAVYIFKYSVNGWVQTQKLFGNDTDGDDGFGHSVSIDNNRLVVGANIINTGGLSNAGAAYVFELNEGVWAQVDKLVADTPTADARFGTAVSLYGDNLAVGSPGVNTDTGAAYVFTYDNGTMQWTQGDTLVDDNSVVDDKFGFSVSVYEDRILVGTDTGPFNNSEGYGTIFENLSNLEQTQLSASDFTGANSYGYSVSLYQNRALIGAFRDRGTNQNRSGSAYLYEYDENASIWNQIEKFTTTGANIGGTNNANFGNAVSLKQDRALVGNFHGRMLNSPFGNPGLAFVFEYDGSIWKRTLLPQSDPGSSAQYGFSVALSDRWAIVGANFDDNTVQKPNAGSASLLDVDAMFSDSFE